MMKIAHFRQVNDSCWKKMFLAMKISAFLLLVALQVSAKDYAQETISLNFKKGSLIEALKAIEKQTDYRFYFSNDIVPANTQISISVKNALLNEVMYTILDGTALTWKLIDQKMVVISVNEDNNTFADIALTGTVKDAEGQPLPGATITEKGTTNIVSADTKGYFNIKVKDEKARLIISFTGYINQEVPVKNKPVLDIVLIQNTTGLNEVVVIGYGTQRKKDLTGSVGSVDIADLNKAPVKSFDDALAGRVAGVQITSPDGQPGASPNIVIRGGNSVTQDNSPLYVVDGFPIENYNNNAISPADIESIEVLKDASSTAIYGARGANGVIIITTKKGKTGAAVITYNTYYGWQKNTATIDLMDPYNFVKYQLEVDSARATASYLTNGKTLDSYKNVPSIDWQNQIFRTALMQNHNLSVRGGTKDTRYSISGSILKQDGTIIASNFKRYQGRATIDQNINTKLKVGINVNYSYLFASGTPVGGNTSQTPGVYQTQNNLLINAWQYRPLNASGNLDSLLFNTQDADAAGVSNYQWNPVSTAENQLRNRTTKLFTTNAYLEYAILHNFKLRIAAGINTSDLRYDAFNTSQSVLGSPLSSLGQGGPNGSVTNTSLNNYVNENTLTYSKIFKQAHTINVVGGFTTQTNTANSNGSVAILVPNEALGVAGLSQGTPFNIVSAQSKNTLASFLGRVNYNYKSKYLLTVSFRADGSSKFVGDNKWGYFPSGAAAWHFSEESIVKKNKFLSDGKLRVSYGVTGNNRVTDFASFGLITQGGGASYAPGNQFISGAYASSLSNPKLKWESTAESDLGLDLGFLNQHIVLSIDGYNKKTTNLLLNAQLPTTTGYTAAFQNVGSVQNRGVEISLATTNLTMKNFSWTSSFNIAFNKTKVLSLALGQTNLLSVARWQNTGVALTPNYIAQLNQPVAMFFGYTWAGNYQYSDFDQPTPGNYVLKTGVPNNGFARSVIKPGDIKYQDINGDGVVDDNDRGVIGNPNPKFIGGFSNNFTYRNFDLNIFFQFVYGNQIMNVNRLLMQGNIANQYASNQYASYINRWSPDNPTNENYRALGFGPSVYSSRIIEDGSFLRLKTFNIGYNLTSPVLKRVKISSLRFYMSAQNVFTWTKYSGLDPEVNSYNSALTPGLDYSAYPRAKVITVGLDVSF